MRTRSTTKRIAELKSWIKKNIHASSTDFIRETGGTQLQLYKLRRQIKVEKLQAKLNKSEGKVTKAPRVKKVRQTAEEFAAPTATEVVVEGVTPDFIWYEMDLLQRKLSDISVRMNHVMKVSQARDADQKKMMRDLISENTELRVNNNSLRQQVTELTEMINGTPV